MASKKDQGSATSDPIRDATLAALKQLLEPLTDLLLDTGITVHEFNQAVRESSVRVATQRVLAETGRESKSRVAIMTGLARSEVTRILNLRESDLKQKPEQNPARRVLAAWFDSPHFLDHLGEPATLPIFGKKRSFERLVEKHGGGIPVRAMLDELTQISAVERLPNQRVKAKVRIPISTGLTTRSIAAVGERGRDLLSTLTHNVRRSKNPFFEATALVDDSELDMVSFARREITEQGTNFITGAASLLSRARKKSSPKVISDEKQVRLGVTVFYFQDEVPPTADIAKAEMATQRKNLRRQVKDL
jgi:Family of unknown function (DUF6502)